MDLYPKDFTERLEKEANEIKEFVECLKNKGVWNDMMKVYRDKNGNLVAEWGELYMLIPAIIKKNEILEAFKRYYYSDDMMYETGGLGNWLPNIQEETEDGRYQYAIVDSNDKLLGYFDYHVDWYTSCAHRFGLISFDRGNPIVGKDLFNELNKLLHDYKLHRIEWRMIGCNPVESSYD